MYSIPNKLLQESGNLHQLAEKIPHREEGRIRSVVKGVFERFQSQAKVDMKKVVQYISNHKNDISGINIKKLESVEKENFMRNIYLVSDMAKRTGIGTQEVKNIFHEADLNRVVIMEKLYTNPNRYGFVRKGEELIFLWIEKSGDKCFNLNRNSSEASIKKSLTERLDRAKKIPDENDIEMSIKSVLEDFPGLGEREFGKSIFDKI